MSFLKRQIKRFSYAYAGIRYAIKYDHSFRLQWYGLGAVVLASLMLIQPITASELLFCILAYALILITELQNSALEYTLDHLHPNTHENIGRSKDMAAGAVLIAGVFLLVVIASLLWIRL
jgi:diacylglycerol kinase (ATP)